MSSRIPNVKKIMVRGGVDFIKPLYKLSAFLCAAPWYDFEKDKLTHEILHKWYSVTGGCILMVVFWYCEIDKLSSIYADMKAPQKTLNIIIRILIFFLCMLTVYVSIFKHRNSWMLIIKGLREFDTTTGYVENGKKRLRFLLQFALEQISVLTILITDSVMSVKTFHSEKGFGYFFMDRINLYFVFLPFHLIAYITNSIKFRFRALNASLLCKYQGKTSCLSSTSKLQSNTVIVNIAVSPLFLEDANKLYASLGFIVEECNKIFGGQILLLFGIILSGQLLCIDNIVVNSDGDNSISVTLLNLLVTLMLMVSF